MNRGFSFRGQKHAEPNHSNIIIDTQVFSSLSKSRWFTRGWTLQELLAPSQMIFFATDWTVLGDRNEISRWIADITGIHIGALKHKSTIPRYTIAQRMSWASTRETTRSEDIAYCLLGIFDIHMPLLYGEGDAAFKRLQQEIMATSDDHSIFSWDLQDKSTELCTGALAASPKAFISCGSVVRNDATWRSPFSVTNLGISIKFPLIHSCYEGIDLVGLNCVRELRGCDDPLDILPDGRAFCRRFQVWIFLRHVQDNIYQRLHVPTSAVFFQPSYHSMIKREKPTLFFEIQKSPDDHFFPLPKQLIPPTRKFIQNSPFSAGIMITFSWGTQDRFNRYEQAFNPGQFYSWTLMGRKATGISHQLVSTRNFCLLFSVSWNMRMQPQHWISSVFADPDREVSNTIIGVDKWKYLLNDGMRVAIHELQYSTDLMSRIHDQLRDDFGDAFRRAGRLPTTPMVQVSPQELQNLHGQRELLVDIRFQENPELG